MAPGERENPGARGDMTGEGKKGCTDCVTIQSHQSFVLVLLCDRTVTFPANKISSRSHFNLIPLCSSHEVVSDTCVVYHRDLPGPLAGGEQPHRRRVLHQFRGKHCSYE